MELLDLKDEFGLRRRVVLAQNCQLFYICTIFYNIISYCYVNYIVVCAFALPNWKRTPHYVSYMVELMVILLLYSQEVILSG